MKMAKLHKFNAYILAIFLLAHLSNHVIGIFGIELHLATQAALRQVYRIPLVEYILLVLFAVQIISGVRNLVKRGRPKGSWAWAQALSGAYIAFFLIQHISAVLLTRFYFSQIDTTAYWASAVVKETVLAFYFVPYYVLAVTALFTHIACAFRFRNWQNPATLTQKTLPFVGFFIGVAIVLSLMGTFKDFSYPATYQDYLKTLPMSQ